ncbi:DUF2202 domain-containing protein [Flavilitoribacter nigricans]|nr:DUF2202 domain-containing protein [Flavilitoribacter nigricans]
MKKIWILILVVAGMALPPAIGQRPAAAADQQLLDLLEEEKLAGEIYVALFDKWGHHSFQNISNAEQRHLEMMRQLAVERGLKLPTGIVNAQTGKFQNQDLQQLYDRLLQEGRQSLTAALQVGALIEETDIRDLQRAIAATDDARAIQVYTALLNGSENHLRAFTRNLDRQGITYRPEVLSAADYDTILAGKSTCSGNCGQNRSGVKNQACKPGKGKGKKSGACCGS